VRRRIVIPPKLKEAILHPLGFAVFPVLSLYVKNMGKGLFGEAVVITAGVIVLAALLWVLVHLFVKDARKSAIIVSILFLLFFSYGHVVPTFSDAVVQAQLVDKIEPPAEGEGLGEGPVEHEPGAVPYLVICGVLFTTISCAVVRSQADLRVATRFLNVAALALVAMTVVNFGIGGARMHLVPRLHAFTSLNADAKQPDEPLSTPAATVQDPDDFDLAEFRDTWQQDISLQDIEATAGSLPDIYYIIVDAYARADILEEIYHFDNSEFLSYLTERGFYVAARSRTNYPQTSLSLSSSLNFMYLDSLAAQMGAETDNRQPLDIMTRNNRLFQYLRSRGYTICAFSTGYGTTDIKNADMYMEPPQWNLSEFQEALIALTPLSLFENTMFDFRRERILYAFDHVADATQIEGPTFTFIHVISPHWPFLFDADGEPIQPPRGIGSRTQYEYDEFIAGYVGQLLFVNGKLKTAIDAILSQSSEPSIIILQADHGPDARLDPEWQLDESYLPERISILNAYYFPDQDYSNLYEDITPVNTFRIVLNQYFGTDKKLLEDNSYFADWNHPYSFIDVTEEVVASH
jgi:hypothetical protein